MTLLRTIFPQVATFTSNVRKMSIQYGLGDTLGGNRLILFQRALDWLAADPLRLDQARQRFNCSPPQYMSDSSGTTTQYASPVLIPSEQQRRQLIIDSKASLPRKQFRAQKREEAMRVLDAHENRTRCLPIGIPFIRIAHENVKKSWVEQGIWNEKWNYKVHGLWKHEEPLEVESESETDSEAESPPRPFPFDISQEQPEPQRKPKGPKSGDEEQRIAKQRMIRERERQASRPYHQFVHQIAKERERIQESTGMNGTDITDINTSAYENVKNFWIWQGIWKGIWNTKWGILPGMFWKHEEPVDLEIGDGPVHTSIISHDAAEAATDLSKEQSNKIREET